MSYAHSSQQQRQQQQQQQQAPPGMHRCLGRVVWLSHRWMTAIGCCMSMRDRDGCNPPPTVTGQAESWDAVIAIHRRSLSAGDADTENPPIDVAPFDAWQCDFPVYNDDVASLVADDIAQHVTVVLRNVPPAHMILGSLSDITILGAPMAPMGVVNRPSPIQQGVMVVTSLRPLTLPQCMQWCAAFKPHRSGATPWSPSMFQHYVDLWCPELAGQRHAKELILLSAMAMRLAPDTACIPIRLLIAGPKGCGKSTLLQRAADLFDAFHVASMGAPAAAANTTRSSSGRRSGVSGSGAVLLDVQRLLPRPLWWRDELKWHCGGMLAAEVLLLDDVNALCASSQASALMVATLLEDTARVMHSALDETLVDATSAAGRCNGGAFVTASAGMMGSSPGRHILATMTVGEKMHRLSETAARRFHLTVRLSSVVEGADVQAVATTALREASTWSAQRLTASVSTTRRMAGSSSRGCSFGSSHASQQQQHSMHPSIGSASPSFSMASALNHIAASAVDGGADPACSAEYVMQRLTEDAALMDVFRRQDLGVGAFVELLVGLSAARRAFDGSMELVPHCVDDVVRIVCAATAAPPVGTLGNPSDDVAADPLARRKRLRYVQADDATSRATAAAIRGGGKRQCARRFLQSLQRASEAACAVDGGGAGEVPIGVCRALFQSSFIGGSGILFDEVMQQLSHDGLILRGRLGGVTPLISSGQT